MKFTVTTEVNLQGDNKALLEAWARFYSAKLLTSETREGTEVDSWVFFNLETARDFCQYCNKLNFISSVSEPIPLESEAA